MIIILIIGIIDLLLAIVIFLRNKNNIINRIISAISLSVFIWILTIYLSWQPSLASQIDLWSNATFWGPSFIGPLLLYFSVIFPGSNDDIKLWKKILLFLPAVVLVGLALTHQINTKTHDPYTIDRGYGIYVFLVYFFTTFICSFWILIKKYRKSVDLKQRKQIMILSYGFMVALIVGIVFNIFFPLVLKNLSMTVIGTPFASSLFVFVMAYTIIMHRLLDIRMAVFRSLGYVILLVILALIYTAVILGTELFLNPNALADIDISQYLIRAITALVLVFMFQPIRKWVSKVTDRIFYKHSYDPELLIDTVTRKVSSTLKVKDILDGVNKAFVDNIKLSRCAIVLFNEDQTIYAKQSVKWESLQTDELFELAKSGRLVSDDLEESNKLKQILQSKNILFAAPVMNGKKVLGIFVSGEKSSGELFNAQDQRVIGIILQSMALATENAKSYEQIEAFNVTLRQKIAEATQELRIKNAMLQKLDKAKDEFVSMASHQLRTPLTSVKGYLSMVVEGDAGKITAQQKSLLDEAYSSNERMVSLVNDFLNVSRIQTGKFMLDKVSVDLAKLVSEEVSNLVQNATKRQIKLDYKAPTNIPTLNIDEGKIRQVVMNYIDNAIYYSNMDSTIKIDLSVDGDDVLFTVKDTGIGVPVSEQAGLFTKFYRASNAKKQRPDGTGVGLYLAKKIITAHDGKIVFSTIEGKGSTFGFRLPIKELELSADKEIENLKD